MLNLRSVIYVSAAALIATEATSQSFDWQEIGGYQSLSIVNSSSGGDDFGVSGFSLDQRGLKLELRLASEIIEMEYPDLSQDYFTLNKEGERISVRPTVAEVWKILSKETGVLGVIPIGYSETAGSADVAGFYRISGRSFNSVYSAPNMDTVLCLNDKDRKNVKDQNFDVPFLFEANVGPKFTFSYSQGIKPVELAHEEISDRWLSTFNACDDMIQVGFRLINPSHILKNQNLRQRLVTELPINLSNETFALTTMMFDRNARFTFVRFGDVSPLTAGKILSSSNFQEKPCARKVSGATNCEIWATMLTAFDDAAMFVRQSADGSVFSFGDPNVISPAVLVLRERIGAQAPSGDGAHEIVGSE